jgi:hypothetical protein
MKNFYFMFGVMAALVLALFLELQEKQKAVEEEAEEKLAQLLVPVVPDRVQEIRWRDFELFKAEVHLEREGRQWRMRAPWKGVADLARVRKLLQHATQLETAFPFPETDEQAADFEVKRRGYIELAGPFGRTRLDIGMRLYSYGDMILVRRAGHGNAVPEIPELLRFPASLYNCIHDIPEHFRRAELVPCGNDELGEIRLLSRERGNLFLRKQEGRWVAHSPFEGPLDHQRARSMTGRLVTLRMDQVVSEDLPPLAEMGLDPPEYLLEFGNGLPGEERKQTAVELGRLESEEAGGGPTGTVRRRLARFPGSARIFVVREVAIEALTGDWFALRDRQVGKQLEGVVSSIQVSGRVRLDGAGRPAIEKGAQPLAIERRGGALRFAAGGAPAPGRAQEWIDAVSRLRGVRFVPKAPYGELEIVGYATMIYADGEGETLWLYPQLIDGKCVVHFGDDQVYALIEPRTAALIWRGAEEWRE